MDKLQQSNLKKNNTVIALFEELADSTIMTQKVKEPNYLATVYYIFQNTSVTKEGHRLLISPGYLELTGVGTRKKIIITEHKKNTPTEEVSDANLVTENPEIIHVSNLEITAIQAGSTILTANKNGFSDSIRVDVVNK